LRNEFTNKLNEITTLEEFNQLMKRVKVNEDNIAELMKRLSDGFDSKAIMKQVENLNTALTETEELVNEFKTSTRTKLDHLSGDTERNQKDIYKLFEELRDFKKGSTNSSSTQTLT
jgi:predicted  nucleic acid-binding Zn-ribbon protein